MSDGGDLSEIKEEVKDKESVSVEERSFLLIYSSVCSRILERISFKGGQKVI